MSRGDKLNWGHCIIWLPMHCLFIAFLILFSIKVSNGLIDFSWAKVFSPFWVMMALFIAFLYLIDHENDELEYFIWTTLFNIAFVVWTILMAIKLQSYWLGEQGPISWWGAMVPLWVLMSLVNIMRRDKRKVEHNKYSKFQGYKKVLEVHMPNFVVSVLVFSVLECIHLENLVHIPWTLRFIPLFYYIFVSISTFFSLAFLNKLDFTHAIPALISAHLILLYLAGMNLIRVASVVLIPIYVLEAVVLVGGFIYILDNI